MEKTVVLQLKNITKRFGSKVLANNNVSLDVYKGEILSILGENGCGKTTLMNMIAGIYYPDSGKILINGEEVIIRSPRDAFEHKIGMIHQHFKLIDIFTAAQNVVLGIENEKYNLKSVNNRIKEMAEKYGFNINLDKRARKQYTLGTNLIFCLCEQTGAYVLPHIIRIGRKSKFLR